VAGEARWVGGSSWHGGWVLWWACLGGLDWADGRVQGDDVGGDISLCWTVGDSWSAGGDSVNMS